MVQTVKCLSTVWETWVWSLGWEVPRRRKWQPTPVLLPRKSHGRRSLVFMGSHRVRHDWATSLSIDYFSLENYYQYCKFLHGADIKTSLCEWDYVSICNMYIGLQNTCSETHIYVHILTRYTHHTHTLHNAQVTHTHTHTHTHPGMAGAEVSIRKV